MKSLIDALKYDRQQRHEYVILLSAPVLLTIYWYYAPAKKFMQYFPVWGQSQSGEIYAHLAQFISFFLLMFVLPWLYLHFGMKKSLSDFGWGLGDVKFGLGFALPATVLLVVPLIYIAAGMPDIQQEYPLAKVLHQRADFIVWYELAYVIFYYIAWEFYFRGFLLFGLKDKFGAMSAVLIQTISSCLVHLGKPDGETLGAILVGIIFGALALRTRSIWYVFLIHAALGVLTDLFVLFR